MTAEVAILNREAVALAADSAVTIGAGNQQKIFPSAQKLFPLSYRYPVGIMFYNNATLAGVPWETIVKTYRGERGNLRLDRLKEHAEDFLQFLHSDRRLFSDAQQEHFFLWTTSDLYRGLRAEIDERAQARGPRSPARRAPIEAIAEEVLTERIEQVQGAPRLPTVEDRLNSALLTDKYGAKAVGVRDFAFRGHRPSDRAPGRGPRIGGRESSSATAATSSPSGPASSSRASATATSFPRSSTTGSRAWSRT